MLSLLIAAGSEGLAAMSKYGTLWELSRAEKLLAVRRWPWLVRTSFSAEPVLNTEYLGQFVLVVRLDYNEVLYRAVL